MTLNLEFGGRTAPELPNRGDGLAGARAFPSILGFLLLLCLLVQGTAVQTHLHFTRQPTSLTAGPNDRLAKVLKTDEGRPAAHCLLCQEAAMAGAYVTPPAIVLPSPPALVLWTDMAALAAFGLARSAPGWWSRAPPQ